MMNGLCWRVFSSLCKWHVLAIEPKISVAGLGMAGVEHSFEITEQGAQSLTGSQYDFHYILD